LNTEEQRKSPEGCFTRKRVKETTRLSKTEEGKVGEEIKDFASEPD
jgi:hypothetical protein